MKKLILNTLLLSSVFSCSSAVFDVPPEVEDFSAEVTYNNKVDILFMIDNSSSMGLYQQRLANQVELLLNSLNSKGLDYQMAVVSSDMRPGGSGGKLIGSPAVLTQATPNLLSLLKERFSLGQGGSDLESGLGSIKDGLEKFGVSSGFLRQDAILALVALTNEDDYSLGDVSDYKLFFDELKPSVPGFAQGWLFNFIGVVSIDGQCKTTAEFKEAGLRYMELADISGGGKNSVCESDLGTAVSNLEHKIVQVLSEFKLNNEPDINSIKVYLNNVLVPQSDSNGWTYQGSRQSIVFHGKYLPGAFDKIRVDFDPSGGN